MSRVYKCFYCKNFINEKDLIEFEHGKTKKTIKRAHKNCREKTEQRNKFFKYFFEELLEIPQVSDKKTYIDISDLGKQFSWKVMFHAVKTKEKMLLDNFSKGWPYIIGIIKNQLPFSKKDIDKQKEITITEGKQNNLILDVTKKQNNKLDNDVKDYSKIFD